MENCGASGDQVMQAFLSFFEKIHSDPKIGPFHIAVFSALYWAWLKNGKNNFLLVFSHEVMPIAKIGGRYTYQRTMKELAEYGYIRYTPSFNRFRGSKIEFVGVKT